MTPTTSQPTEPTSAPATSSTPAAHTPSNPDYATGLLRDLTRREVPGFFVLGAAFVLLIAAITAGLHLVFDAAVPVWAGAVQAPRWFTFVGGIYVTGVYLPVYIAHGRTRHEVMRAGVPYAALVAMTVTVVIMAGYAVDIGIHRLFGAPGSAALPQVFDSPSAFIVILLGQVVAQLVYAAVGLFVGAAFYRSVLLGLVIIPLAIAMVASTELTARLESLAPFTLGPDEHVGGFLFVGFPSSLLGVAICLAVAALATTAAWPIVRTMPVRSRAA